MYSILFSYLFLNMRRVVGCSFPHTYALKKSPFEIQVRPKWVEEREEKGLYIAVCLERDSNSF